MRAADLTTALVLMAGGVLVIWDSLRLGIGWGSDGPKSGFFPFWLAALLIVCCAAIVWQARRRVSAVPFVTRAQIKPVLSTLLPSAGFVVLTQFLGLYVASALFMAFYMRWIGRYGWVSIVLTSVLFPVLTFLIFETWFLVPMPKGPVEAWLGY